MYYVYMSKIVMEQSTRLSVTLRFVSNAYMWERIQDMATVTTAKQQEIICTLSSRDISDDLE